MKKVMVILFTLFISTLPPAFSQEAAVGETAPDFTLPDTFGRSHSLSDYSGKTVVLEWINPDCPFVKKHYGSGNMQQLQNFASDNGVVWLSIASSAPGKQGHFEPEAWNEILLEQEASPTALLLDPEGNTGRAYGAQTTPHMYVINPEGTLVYQGAIDSVPSVDPDDIPGAENYVRDALEATLAGEPVETASTQAYGCSVKY